MGIALTCASYLVGRWAEPCLPQFALPWSRRQESYRLRLLRDREFFKREFPHWTAADVERALALAEEAKRAATAG